LCINSSIKKGVVQGTGLAVAVLLFIFVRRNALKQGAPSNAAETERERPVFYYAEGLDRDVTWEPTVITDILGTHGLGWRLHEPKSTPPGNGKSKTRIAQGITDIDFLYVRRFFPLSPPQYHAICETGRMFHNHVPHDQHLSHKDLVVKHLQDQRLIGAGPGQVSGQ
jgi:hypothetical protein